MSNSPERKSHPPRRTPPPDFDEKMARVFSAWAEEHPQRDEPVLLSADGRCYTPRQLAREVAERTEIGRIELDALRAIAIPAPLRTTSRLDKVLVRARREAFAEAFLELTESVLSGRYPPPTSIATEQQHG